MTNTRAMRIWVKDEAKYATYRCGMMPILKPCGVAFGYDFRVSKVLKSKESGTINRVFTIEFQSQNAMDEFLAIQLT